MFPFLPNRYIIRFIHGTYYTEKLNMKPLTNCKKNIAIPVMQMNIRPLPHESLQICI